MEEFPTTHQTLLPDNDFDEAASKIESSYDDVGVGAFPSKSAPVIPLDSTPFDSLSQLKNQARLESQLELLQSTVESATREKSELQLRLAHLEAHNRVITASLQSVSAAREDVVRELSSVKSSSRSAEQKLQLVSRELQYKTNECVTQKTRLDGVQKKVDELRKAHSDAEVVREEKDGVIKALKGKVSDQQMELEQVRIPFD